MNFLQTLLGIGQDVGHAASGAAHAVEGAVQHAGGPIVAATPAIAPAIHPDFTYNPGPANIPNSSHNLLQAMAANGQFPRSAAMTVGQANQYVNAQQFPQLGQGGNFNPGFIPLQANPIPYQAGPQPTAQIHGQGVPQAPVFNPQQGLGLY